MRVKGVNINVGDMVYIRWEDHWGNNAGGSWMKADKIDLTPIICETVGWVVKQNNHLLVTVQAHDGQTPEPYINGAYSVCPKRMIVSIKVLKKNKGKKNAISW